MSKEMDLKATTPAGPREVPAGVGSPSGVASSPRPSELVVRIVLGVIAAILVILAWQAPLWRSSLNAPQYPGGLNIAVYGDRVEGDVREVSALNHYVGMKPYDIDEFPEVALWTPTIVAALGAIAVSVIYGRRLPGRIARLAIWAIPVGILVDVQFRLYQFGHELVTEPRPALPIDPFTPKVIGPTKVLNFTNWAMPGLAVWLLLGAAALLSFGPGLGRRVSGLARWLDQPVGTRTTDPDPASS